MGSPGDDQNKNKMGKKQRSAAKRASKKTAAKSNNHDGEFPRIRVSWEGCISLVRDEEVACLEQVKPTHHNRNGVPTYAQTHLDWKHYMLAGLNPGGSRDDSAVIPGRMFFSCDPEGHIASTGPLFTTVTRKRRHYSPRLLEFATEVASKRLAHKEITEKKFQRIMKEIRRRWETTSGDDSKGFMVAPDLKREWPQLGFEHVCLTDKMPRIRSKAIPFRFSDLRIMVECREMVKSIVKTSCSKELPFCGPAEKTVSRLTTIHNTFIMMFYVHFYRIFNLFQRHNSVILCEYTGYRREKIGPGVQRVEEVEKPNRVQKGVRKIVDALAELFDVIAKETPCCVTPYRAQLFYASQFQAISFPLDKLLNLVIENGKKNLIPRKRKLLELRAIWSDIMRMIYTLGGIYFAALDFNVAFTNILLSKDIGVDFNDHRMDFIKEMYQGNYGYAFPVCEYDRYVSEGLPGVEVLKPLDMRLFYNNLLGFLKVRKNLTDFMNPYHVMQLLQSQTNSVLMKKYIHKCEVEKPPLFTEEGVVLEVPDIEGDLMEKLQSEASRVMAPFTYAFGPKGVSAVTKWFTRCSLEPVRSVEEIMITTDNKLIVDVRSDSYAAIRFSPLIISNKFSASDVIDMFRWIPASPNALFFVAKCTTLNITFFKDMDDFSPRNGKPSFIKCERAAFIISNCMKNWMKRRRYFRKRAEVVNQYFRTVCAQKIQVAARGRLLLNRCRRRAEAKVLKRKELVFRALALHASRQVKKREAAAATLIVSAVRMYWIRLGMWRFSKLKEFQRLARAKLNRRNSASMCIQGWVRGWLGARQGKNDKKRPSPDALPFKPKDAKGAPREVITPEVEAAPDASQKVEAEAAPPPVPPRLMSPEALLMTSSPIVNDTCVTLIHFFSRQNLVSLPRGCILADGTVEFHVVFAFQPLAFILGHIPPMEHIRFVSVCATRLHHLFVSSVGIGLQEHRRAFECALTMHSVALR